MGGHLRGSDMDKKPDKPYIYQPYGSQDEVHWGVRRIYGIGGVSVLATIKGLTKDEAELMLEAILSPPAVKLAEKDKDIEMLKAEVKNAWAERNLVVERVRELEAKLKPQIDNGDEERRLLREEAEDRKGE